MTASSSDHFYGVHDKFITDSAHFSVFVTDQEVFLF